MTLRAELETPRPLGRRPASSRRAREAPASGFGGRAAPGVHLGASWPCLQSLWTPGSPPLGPLETKTQADSDEGSKRSEAGEAEQSALGMMGPGVIAFDLEVSGGPAQFPGPLPPSESVIP